MDHKNDWIKGCKRSPKKIENMTRSRYMKTSRLNTSSTSSASSG